jgi:hypothetical protein
MLASLTIGAKWGRIGGPAKTRRDGIGGRRLGLAQDLAEIEKMLLVGTPLGEIGPLPLGDELLRRHARVLRPNVGKQTRRL